MSIINTVLLKTLNIYIYLTYMFIINYMYFTEAIFFFILLLIYWFNINIQYVQKICKVCSFFHSFLPGYPCRYIVSDKMWSKKILLLTQKRIFLKPLALTLNIWRINNEMIRYRIDNFYTPIWQKILFLASHFWWKEISIKEKWLVNIFDVLAVQVAGVVQNFLLLTWRIDHFIKIFISKVLRSRRSRRSLYLIKGAIELKSK